MKHITYNSRAGIGSCSLLVFFIALTVLMGVFGLAGVSYGDTCGKNLDGTEIKDCYKLDNPLGATNTIPLLVCKVLEFLSKMVMPPVAVFMALYASFLLLTSVGSPGKVTAARTVLVSTVLGAGIILLAVPLVALVIEIFNPTGTIQGCGLETASSTFIETIIRLINWFSWFIAILSVAIGLYSGFVYMTGRGEPQKVAMASKMIVYAVIGIAVAVLAFSIITIVKGFLGVDSNLNQQQTTQQPAQNQQQTAQQPNCAPGTTPVTFANSCSGSSDVVCIASGTCSMVLTGCGTTQNVCAP